MMIALLLLTGLVALYFGAEWLVRGGASFAVRMGLTPLMVGLTIVAYGTSTPELIVSATAAAEGNGAIAIGNAVGSNIFNMGVILGLTALLCPLRVRSQLVRVDTPIMVGAALLFLVFFLDGQIQAWEASVFLLGIVAYTILNIKLARREASAPVRDEFSAEIPKPTGALWRDLALMIGGLAVLVVGSRLFVTGAVDLARLFGISDAVIGLTVIAAGTSLPELASSLMAAYRRHPDIAIGNVIGSNIYNIVAILGVSGFFWSPLDGQGVSMIDTVVMLGFSLVILVISWTGYQLRRWEGVLLLALYGGYLWHLWPQG